MAFSEWSNNKKKKKNDSTSTKKASSFSEYSNAKLGITEDEDDIAPVKDNSEELGGKKDSWFKSGAFSDGYQFGDYTKTSIATQADALLNIGKGAMRMVEGVVDLGTYGVAGVADWIGADDFAEKTRKVARYSATDEWTKDRESKFDKYSLLGDKADAVAEGLGQVGTIILTGGIAGGAGLGAAATTAITTGSVGLSATGNSMTEAYEMGATDEQAFAYGATTGAIEAVSELIFGGLGKGFKALGISKGLTSIDDVFAKKLSKTAAKFITSEAGQKIVGNALEYGVKSSAEGLEEVISGFGTAIAKDAILLNEENEEDFRKILDDENLLEQFVVGSLTSAIVQGGEFVGSTKNGRDFITGLSKNEQTVVDKVYEQRLAEESENRTLSKLDQNKLYERVVEEMKRGYVTTDEIESILGGEAYKGYKDLADKENSLKSRRKAIEEEIKALVKTPESQFTVEQREKLNSLREESKGIKETLTNLGIKTAKHNLFNEVNKLTSKDTYLRESYNDLIRQTQNIEIDETKYKGTKFEDAAKKTIANARNAGASNSNRVRDFVEFSAKYSSVSGTVVDFKDDKQVKQILENQLKSEIATLEKSTTEADKQKLVEIQDMLKQVQEGKIKVNGVKTKDGVAINIDSPNYLNTILGHEITHFLEGKNAYEPLQKAIFKYAKSKGDYEGRRSVLDVLYKNVKDTTVDYELTADLVGDYLFTEYDFIKNLSTENRNVFQYVFDQIKYAYKLATAGSKEARELEKVMRQFEKALRESAEASDKTQFSMTGDKSLLDNKSSLEKAKAMLEQGEDNEIIRQATNWFKSYDGEWRYEIDDSELKYYPKGQFTNPDVLRRNDLLNRLLNDELDQSEFEELKGLENTLKGVKKTPKTLGDYIDHEKLFRAYPQLEDVKLKLYNSSDFETLGVDKNTVGYYDSHTKTIILNKNLNDTDEKVKQTLIHEIQHAIQDIEGFAKGASVEYWQSQRRDIVDTIKGAKENLDLWLNDIGYSEFAKSSMQEVANNEKTLEQHWEDCKEFKANSKYAEQIANCEEELAEFQQQYDEITNGMTAFEQYQNTAGEIEARDVENRLNLNAEERKNTRPDIDRSDVVFAEEGTPATWLSKDEVDYDPETATLREQIINAQDTLNKRKVVASANYGKQQFKNKAEAKKWAQKTLAQWGGQVDRQNFGIIFFSKSDVDYAIEHINDPYQQTALGLLPYVLKRGDIIGEHNSHKMRGKHTITIGAPIEINGTRGNMGVVVNMNGKHAYSARVLLPDGSAFIFSDEIEKTSQGMHQGVLKNESLADTTSEVSDNSIAPLPENVNTQFSISADKKKADADYKFAVESGDTEIAQQILDESAKKAGYDIKAYHGTGYDFTVFDKSRQGNNYEDWGRLGKGFYFAPTSREAETWAELSKGGKNKVMPVYLRSENMLDSFEALPDNLKDTIPENWDSLTRRLAEKYAYNYIEYMQEFGYDVQKILTDKGYDGINGHTEFVVFDPEQVKSADLATYDDKGNVIPLSQRFDKANEDIRYSLSYADYQTAVDNNDIEQAQKMVDEQAKANGYTVKAYHGTGRADRVGNVFLPERATSGPMAFFTDNKDIATNYAKDKADTSLAYDEEYDSYYTQFRVNRNGKSISVPELWKYLSVSERNRIKEQAAHIKFDDDYETIIVDESAQHGNGAWDAYTLNMHKGNALEALVDTWLETGDLYNQEELFLEVLKNVGITDAEYRNPDARYEKVYDTWLKIQNPFDTANVNQSFYDNLSKWIENNDMSVYEKETANADMWDKNNQTPESWLEKLANDIEDGGTHAWTVIPDFVTDYLKEQGYDGIKDTGGKGGGAGHTVWIPFSSEQVKSAEPVTYDDNGNVIPLSQRFDSSKVDIRNSLSYEGEKRTLGGNYRFSGQDFRIKPEQDIAPVREGIIPNIPNAVRNTPTSKRIASGERSDDLLYESLVNYPMQTVEQKISEKIRALQGEIADKNDLRKERWEYFENRIADLRAKYDSKKNKDTKEANKILQSISRLERLKASEEADFAKRISDLEARVEKMSDPTYSRAMYKQSKMKAKAQWAADLLGDTSTWKDKKLGLQYATNTERRNLRDIVRDENGNADIARADAIYDSLMGEYNRNHAELNRKDNEISQKYLDLKINRAESVYANMLGELRHNPDTTLTEKVVNEYYEKHKDKIDTKKVDKIIDFVRSDLDYLIETANAKLREQGMKEIAYRKGYFPHGTFPKQNFFQKLINWKTQDTEIPTSIAGLTEDFKPVKSYQTFDKQRHTDETDYDIMRLFEKYKDGALDWIYHIEDIQKRRAVENYVRYTHSDEGVKARIEEVYANEEYDADEAQAQIEHILAEAKNPLNNFVQDFMTHTNILANKKNSLDRTTEQMTNRKIYSVMQNVQNRTSANMVLANVRSALTNFIPITQSWAQVSPLRSLQATKDAIANAIKDDGLINKSTYLTNRLKQADKLYQTNWDKVLDKAGIMFEVIDNFSSQVIWRSKYNQNLSNGMTEAEAIANADQFAENVMAGRSKGNEPTLFNAKNPLVKAFTMFQLEVNNQYGYFFKDVPNDLKAETNHWKLNLAKGYATAFIGAYVYNALLEKVAGSGAALDPIGIIEDLLKDLGLFDDDEEEKEPGKALANFAENVTQELPFVGGLLGGGRIPISSAIPYSGEYSGGLTQAIEDTTKTFGAIGDTIKGNFDEADWSGAKNIGKELMNPLLNVGLPVGGGQIKKTVQGLNMFSDEHPVTGSYTGSGNLRFPVEDTPLNRVQAAIFGQYASENAREYFDNDYAPLKEKQIQEYKDVDIPIKDYWEYRKGLAKQDKLEDKFDYIAGLDLPVEKKNILINNVVDRKTDVDLTNYDDFNNYEEFDFAAKQPEKYALAKSVGGYSAYKTYSDNLNDIKADKDVYGKSISGSRKEKVLNYINNLDADYETKLILFKSEYPSDDTYNMEIINYLNSRDDISYDEMVDILKELDFTVTADGTIYWD